MTFPDFLPALDCHAHIAPDVTSAQVRELDGAVVFAVTRSLEEAGIVARRSDPGFIWGCGVHPGLRESIDSFDVDLFSSMIDRFLLIGEVGLDRRAGSLPIQRRVFQAILEAIEHRPILASVHSAGCPAEVVEALAASPPRGGILHWFTGKAAEIDEAAAVGCSFSVNVAMTDDQIRELPPDRVLPETDFPHARPRVGKTPNRPADISPLEERLAQIWTLDQSQVRSQLFRNLRGTVQRAGMLDRIPEWLADFLLAV